MKRTSKIVMVLAVLVAGSMIASGALVSYLSNTATITMEVESPIVMAFDGGTYGETATLDLGTIYGGDVINYKVWSKNQASANVDSYPITTIISHNSKWTGEEFTSVTFTDGNGGPFEILPKLYVVKDDGTLSSFTTGAWKTSGVANKYTLKLFFDNDGDGTAQKYTHIPGQTWNDITITTNSALAPGDYSVKLCHLYDISANCP
jgi:hypothetical protein